MKLSRKILKNYDSKLFKTEYDLSEISMLLEMSKNRKHSNILTYNDLIFKPTISLISEYHSVICVIIKETIYNEF